MGGKGGRSFFHLSRPASALSPGNRTPPLWAGTCRREVDTFVRQKRGPTEKQWWCHPVKWNEQQGLSVYFLVWVAAAVLMTDDDDWDSKLNTHFKKSFSTVFGNSHIINVCSCSALQDFICDLQVRWDFWMLQRYIFGSLVPINIHSVNS